MAKGISDPDQLATTGQVVAFPSLGTSPIRPLTAQNAGGKPYVRFEHVQAQLEHLVMHDAAQWPELARHGIRSEGGMDQVANEAIVHLIRVCWGTGNDSILFRLHSLLLDRMERTLRRKASQMRLSDPEPMASWVQNRIIQRLYSRDSRAADFLEVAFNKVVLTYCLKWSQSEGEYWKRIEIDSDAVDSAVDAQSEITIASLSKLEASIDAQRIVAVARKTLPEPQFEAFYLHYVKGLSITSSNPLEPTLVRHFRRSPRTIHLWLDRSIKLLQKKICG